MQNHFYFIFVERKHAKSKFILIILEQCFKISFLWLLYTSGFSTIYRIVLLPCLQSMVCISYFFLKYVCLVLCEYIQFRCLIILYHAHSDISIERIHCSSSKRTLLTFYRFIKNCKPINQMVL